MEHLTKEELHRLLTVARQHSERDYCMILTAYAHGLRASEVCGLTTDQIKDGYITIQRLKGSLHTTQPLVHSDDPLLDEQTVLGAYIAGRSGLLFGIRRAQFFNLFRKYAVLAGIPAHKCHPHVLKHTTAMLNIKSAGIENVRVYLGHKSIASTGAYLRVSDSEAAAAMAF